MQSSDVYCPPSPHSPLCVLFIIITRWNSSTMRRWLKENNLAPGTGRAKGGNMMVSLDDLSNPHIGMHDPPRSALKASSSYGGGHETSPTNDSFRLGPVGGGSTSRMPAHLRPPLIITEHSKGGRSGSGISSLLNVPLPSPTVQVATLSLI